MRIFIGQPSDQDLKLGPPKYLLEVLNAGPWRLVPLGP